MYGNPCTAQDARQSTLNQREPTTMKTDEIHERYRAGLLLRHRDARRTARADVEALGGIWDSAHKGYLMPDRRSLHQALMVCHVEARRFQMEGLC